ncbi:MAG TPA: 2-amino-4-hydroxy-6-hydroxymethyldihydropteridine diphosphokinase [Anaerolineaceae bacterium]|nr:2-amino-4-hydroxy-6-hydroxymethyldihydropteridine diphosphokinase [Anaerolineaceae bacterium]
MNRVFLILGSNIDPDQNIARAIHLLKVEPGMQVLRCSSIWKTRPVGTSSIDFYNMAVEISTEFDQFHLKENVFCRLESELGRVRVEDKYAPRTIDLDIVIFNDQVLESDLFRFDYLVLPFAELNPELVDPKSGLTLLKLAKTIGPFSTARKLPA